MAELTPMLQAYAKEGRRSNNSTSGGGPREWFGDFCIRKGYVKGQVSVPVLQLAGSRPSGVTFHEHTPIW